MDTEGELEDLDSKAEHRSSSSQDICSTPTRHFQALVAETTPKSCAIMVQKLIMSILLTNSKLP